MTDAERKRKSRFLKVNPPLPLSEDASMGEWLARKTRREQAAFFGSSERYNCYHNAYIEHRAFDWDAVLTQTKKRRQPDARKVGLRWVAEVCKRYSRHTPDGAETQRLLFEMVKSEGAKYAQRELERVEWLAKRER